MLLSLPPSLITLVLCFLDSRVLAEPAATPTPHAGDIAGYVAAGFGINGTHGHRKGKFSLDTTGTGPDYASKCADALKTWSSSSFNWGWDNPILATSTFSSGFTETFKKPGSTKVTSVITLCDGYPRVVGHTSVSSAGSYTTTAAWTNINTISSRNLDFPTPAPCSIQPSDCKKLSSSYEVSLSKALAASGQATGEGPLCTVTPSSSYSYSTNPGGKTCDNCLIHASTARVMFWPVTTRTGGDLCNSTGSTITASPTGPPKSFVTEGITITSPTVAVSLAYMSRVDGCGVTINHTIIPVRPEDVTSVRGFRALFTHHQFNFADLNYFCRDTNTTEATIPDGEGDSCYQQVPADAYFGGLNNAVVLDQAPFRNLSKSQMTIWDDYQPQLLPPQTLTKTIASLWGENCFIHPDGVWDPPIALTAEASLVVPTLPGGGGSTTSDAESSKATPASPINDYGAVPPRQTGIAVPTRPSEGDTTRQHFTALPQTTSGESGGDGNSGHQSEGSGNGNQGAAADQPDQGSPSNQQGSNGGAGSSNSGSNGGSGENANNGDHASGSSSSGGSGSNAQNGDQGDGSGSQGSTSNQQNSNSGSGSSDSASNGGSGENVNNGNQASGSSSSDGSDENANNGNHASGSSSSGGSGSNAQDGNQGGDSGSDAGGSNSGHITSVHVHTTVITVGSKTLQCTQNSDGAWVIPDGSTTHLATPGGSAIEIDAATLTAGGRGLVNMHTSVVTIGSKTLTCTQNAAGAWIIPDGTTTQTVSQGGSAVQVDAVTLTAGPDGLVNKNEAVVTIGDKVLTGSKDSNGAWVIPDGTTTHTISRGGSALEVDGATLTAASDSLVDMDTAIVTAGDKTLTGSRDSNGAWVITDGTKTYTASPGGSTVVVDGVKLSAASSGLVNMHASTTGESSESSTGSSTNRVQLTSGTGTGSSSTATDTGTSGAAMVTRSPASLVLFLIALVFCAP